MSKNPFAYHVSSETRRREVVENERILAQIDALEANGLAFHIEAYATKWDDHFEPWMLLAWSAEAAAALVPDVEKREALAAYVDFDADRFPWLYTLGDLPKGWYKIGEATARDIEARFGERLSHPKHWAKMRADAKRRLRTAKKALGEV